MIDSNGSAGWICCLAFRFMPWKWKFGPSQIFFHFRFFVPLMKYLSNKKSNLYFLRDMNIPVSQTPWNPPPPHWKNRPRFCPWWKKYPKISFPLENYTELSSPLGKALKFWESSLVFWDVNNRIQNSHPLKARDFPSPLAFGSFILSPLANKFSPVHWDRGVYEGFFFHF